MNPIKLLTIAAAISRVKQDKRTFRLGAVAIREDDVLVYSCNGYSNLPSPRSHCEARLVRKLDKGATVFLARTLFNGDWANSLPCKNCCRALRRAKVKKVYYTSGPGTWESFIP